MYSRGLEGLSCTASLLQACFGPNGLHGLLEGSDGRAMFVESGVEAFGLQKEPVLRFIGESLRHLGHSTGEGTKKMAIMLVALLKECEHVLSEKRTCIERTIIPNLIDKRYKMCCSLRLTVSKQSLRLHLEKILNTSLSSRCTYTTKKRMKEILMEFLLPQDSQADTIHQAAATNRLRRLISHYQQWFDVHVVCVEGVSVSQSRVVPGFLLDRELSDPSVLKSLSETPRFKVLLLHSDLSIAMGDATLCVSSSGHLEQTMDHLTVHCGPVVEWLTGNNVRLLLSSVALSQGTVRDLSRHNIAAVQMVDADSLLAIAEYCGTPIFLHISDLNTDLPDKYTAYCTSFRYINVGRKRLLHLEFQRSSSSGHSESDGHLDSESDGHRDSEKDGCPDRVQSILLCAPTSRQLAQIISNSLKVVHSWTNPVFLDGELKLVSVCGGGAWEISLAQELEDYIKSNNIYKDTARWTAIKALQKGLLQIPHSLILNASPLKVRRENTRRLLLSDVGHAPSMMVSATDGSLIEVREVGFWAAAEPLTIQQEVLTSVLGLVYQLLRVDDIIVIKRGAAVNDLVREDHHYSSESDSEGEPT